MLLINSQSALVYFSGIQVVPTHGTLLSYSSVSKVKSKVSDTLQSAILQVMQAKVSIPFNAYGGDVEEIKPKIGQNTSKDLSCHITSVHKLIVDGIPTTIVVGRVMKKNFALTPAIILAIIII